jgi:hypothetical protein
LPSRLPLSNPSIELILRRNGGSRVVNKNDLALPPLIQHANIEAYPNKAYPAGLIQMSTFHQGKVLLLLFFLLYSIKTLV